MIPKSFCSPSPADHVNGEDCVWDWRKKEKSSFKGPALLGYEQAGVKAKDSPSWLPSAEGSRPTSACGVYKPLRKHFPLQFNFSPKAQVHNFPPPTLAVRVSPRYILGLVTQAKAAFVWGARVPALLRVGALLLFPQQLGTGSGEPGLTAVGESSGALAGLTHSHGGILPKSMRI